MSTRPPFEGRVVVVGDLINDIVAIPLGPIRPDTDTTSTVLPRPGGSAANTAAWLGSLGVPVDLVSAVGREDAAAHERLLRDAGVEPHFQIEVAAPTGTIVIIVEGQRRTMLTSRGANALLSTATVTDELLDHARHVHVAAYAFLDGFGAAGAQDLVRRAHERGATVSFNPGSAGYLRDYGVGEFLAATAGADLLFPNLEEATILTGEHDQRAALTALLGHYPTAVVTAGAAGSMAAARGGAVASMAAPSVRLVDPTGAGDSFCAGFLSRWLGDPDDLDAALVAATFAASRSIMVAGGRPPV